MHFGSVLTRWVYTFMTTFFHLFVRWFFIFSSLPPHSGLASPGVGGSSSFGASLVSEAWWCFIGSSLFSSFSLFFVILSTLVYLFWDGLVLPSCLLVHWRVSFFNLFLVPPFFISFWLLHFGLANQSGGSWFPSWDASLVSEAWRCS